MAGPGLKVVTVRIEGVRESRIPQLRKSVITEISRFGRGFFIQIEDEEWAAPATETTEDNDA